MISKIQKGNKAQALLDGHSLSNGPVMLAYLKHKNEIKYQTQAQKGLNPNSPG